MDSFSFNNLQTEKSNAILKNQKLRKITSFLRFVELCSVLLLVSRFTLFLPIAVKNSSEYFRDFSLNSPGFVFLIGNLIIIALFAQSRHFSKSQASAKNDQEIDLYHQFVQKSTKGDRIEGDFKYPEKQRVRSKEKNQEKRRINRKTEWLEKQREKTGEANNGYRRCESEISKRVKSEKPRGMLRRCETEKNRMKSIEFEACSTEEVREISYPEDDMSNEEFRRTVEAFIDRQQRIRRQESYYLL